MISQSSKPRDRGGEGPPRIAWFAKQSLGRVRRQYSRGPRCDKTSLDGPHPLSQFLEGIESFWFTVGRFLLIAQPTEIDVEFSRLKRLAEYGRSALGPTGPLILPDAGANGLLRPSAFCQHCKIN